MATELFAPASPDVLYLIDLSSFVLRAYHALQPLSSPSGEPTHAVYVTVTMLERLVRQQRPAMLAVAMDSGRKTFRQDIYPEYKAHRPPAPDDLKQQMQRVQQIVEAFGIPILKQDGVEADDLIACAVARAADHGVQVVIVAADKDLMQLVGPSVVMWDTMRDRVFGVPEVKERFGVEVAQVRDLLALMGDTSDNVPGVPSVGPKTARDLLLQFGTLEGIYDNLQTLTKKKLKETLAAHRDQAFLSQQLVTLKEDCPIEFDLTALRYGGRNVRELRRIYGELGFQRQLMALEAEAECQDDPEATATAPVEAIAAPTLQTATTAEALQELAERIRSQGRVSLFVATAAGGPPGGELIGLALSAQAGTAAYVPLAHRYVGAPAQPGALVREILGPLLADPEIEKGADDLKRVEVALAGQGMAFAGGSFDAKLVSYLIDPDAAHDLGTLAKRELGLVPPTFDEVTRKARGSQLSFEQVTVEEATRYAASLADASARLWDRLLGKLGDDAGLARLYETLELPLTSVLAQMERDGVLVDTARLAEIGRRCEKDLHRLEQEAHRIAGKPFNVHSPRQLETLLFDDCGLKPLKRTKTSRSTDAETLEALADQHELPRVILEIRQLAKLKGTYLDALPLLVNSTTGRIHTRWEQAVAATGRLSSTEPNLQNIPIRTELGRSIRTAFVAPPGHHLVSADYSQIELRVLAHLSRDPVLLEAFRSGQDIHTRTAMEIFDVPESGVTREMRTRAKAVNFGVIYGQGDSGLAKVLGIPRAQAANFIATYFRRYHGVREFMNGTLDTARTSESVKSLLGRRRPVPDIKHGNRARRLAAERIAMNMPIQGTAADLLKLSMLALAKPKTPDARMVLTVHDELVFEVPDGEVERAKLEIREVMQNVAQLDVPLVVEVGAGRNWNEAH